jgi:hypothetical protein
MRLLFAHAFIVLFTIAVGVTRPSGTHPPTVTPQQTLQRYFKADASLKTRTGTYTLYPNFREEFFFFDSVYIPSDEDQFIATLQNNVIRTSAQGARAWALKSLIIEGDRIAFQTNDDNGESYGFTGSFRLNTRCTPDITIAGMEGLLNKYSDGVLVATTNASFHLVYGC